MDKSKEELLLELKEALEKNSLLQIQYENEIRQRQEIEANLAFHNERFELSMKAANFAWWEMDVPTGNVKFSDHKAEILGFVPEKFTHYKDFMTLVHPDDYNKTMTEMVNHFNGLTENYNAQYRIRAKSGEYKWFHDIGKITQRDSDGKPLVVSGIVIDIIDKIKLDEVQKENEIRFKLMFQDHKSVMLLIDPQGGIIIDANKSAEQFYKYPIDQLRGMPIEKINVLSEDEIAVERGKATTEEQNLFIFPHRISSGEMRQVEVHSSPIELNGQKLLFSVIHDITEREALNDKRKKNEDALRKAEEIGKFGNWYLFLDEKLIKASDGARNIYGFDKNEITLDTVKGVALSDYRPMLNKALEDLILYGKQYDVEYKIKRKSDGEIVDIQSVAEFDASKNIVFGTIQDISERKRTEQAMIESEEKFHSLFANMIEGAALHTLLYNQQGDPEDYVIIETNPAFEVQLGISREKVINKTSREAYGVDDPPFLDIYSKVALTKEPVVFETFFPPVDKHFSISVYSPYKGSFATIFVDITERKKAEQTIRESESRYHGLLDHLDAGIMVHAADTSIIMANPRAAELLGLSEEQMKGKMAVDPQWKFLLDDFSPMPLAEYPVNKIISSRKPIKDYLIGIQRSAANDVAWLLVNGLPTLDENDGIKEVLISFTDITEHKIIEDHLLESQQLLHEAQRLAQIGVWNWDNESNIITWSEELCKIVGRDPNLPVPAFKDQQFVFTPQSYEQFTAAIEKVKETGLKIEIELEVVHSDKSRRNVVGFVGMKLDGKGRMKGLYGTLQDITERKLAEQALLNSEQKLDTMLQTMVDGMVTINLAGEITYCNPAAEQILDMSKNVLGKYFQSTEWNQIDDFGNPFPPDQLPLAIALREQRTVTNIEHAFISSLGKIKWISVNAAPLFDDKGMLFGGIASFRDTTERKRAEAELREANAYLENLINYANAPIIVWDPQFKITRFNHAFETLTGRLESDVLGKSLDILFPPELAENSMELIRKTLSGERWETVEIIILNINGTVRTVLWNSATLFGPDGKTPVATIAQGQDITKRKQAEEELQKSQFNLNNAQHMAHMGSWEWDMKTNTVNFSDELFRIFGLSAETSLINADSLLEYIHPDDKEFYLSNLENSSLKGESVPFEYRIVRSDGEVRNLHASGHVIYDGNHKPVKGIGVVQDITERKQAEEALRESKNQLNQILQTTDQGIYGIDLNGCCTFINQSGYNALGYPAEECIGRNMHELIHHHHPDGTFYDVNDCPIFHAKLTAQGSQVNSEVFWRKDGTSFPTEYSSFPTFENGEISGAVVTFADITERKRVEEEIKVKNEELLRLVTEKDKLFSIIAHDLRSPFNAFLGFTRMMVEDLPSLRLDEIQTMAMSMRTSATNLYRLLENLLEWSRIQRGMTGFEPKPFLLLPQIAESLHSVLESADKKGIETVFAIPDNLLVFADENMLTSAIRNLISNSVKFTDKGGKITVKAEVKDNNMVEISVRDTGIGMNKTMLRKIFDPTSNSSRKGTEGELSTGLGLIICKDFIEKQGGKIWAESEEGKGSIFYFTIPGNMEKEEKPVSKNALAEGKEKQARKLKILIAEDDETSEMLLAMAVKPVSKEVIRVQTGDAAVEVCRNTPDIDLVIMDIKMPVMDGYEATKLIRQFNKTVVIIAQTAFGLSDDREKSLNAGCNDYLSKPIELVALRELIQKHFDM